MHPDFIPRSIHNVLEGKDTRIGSVYPRCEYTNQMQGTRYPVCSCSGSLKTGSGLAANTPCAGQTREIVGVRTSRSSRGPDLIFGAPRDFRPRTVSVSVPGVHRRRDRRRKTVAVKCGGTLVSKLVPEARTRKEWLRPDDGLLVLRRS